MSAGEIQHLDLMAEKWYNSENAKNDFLTRRLTGWNPATFLRREPIWNIGAFAVENRLCTQYYKGKKKICQVLNAISVRRNGVFLLLNFVVLPVIWVEHIKLKKEMNRCAATIFKKWEAGGLGKCNLFTETR